MNLYQIDAAYRPFPSFSEWAKLLVDEQRWEKAVASLPDARSLPREQLAQAHRIAMRAAAVDTGALEGLYDADRGFTMTIALQTAAWESVLNARGEKVRSLIESQMHAYDFVIDLATESEPVSEMWIRALHERICESQDTYPVLTEVGWQNQPLPKGQYKPMPNHVRLQDGSFHAYAPVDMVPMEMHRLVEELRGDAFRAAHPVLQSAYVHYALVCIHPFADGNGRVARALASVFTYRSHSVPLLILVEHKPAYLAALRQADQGEPQAFVDFVFQRTIDAISLVGETLRAAAAPDPELEAAKLRAAFFPRGEIPPEQVDSAGLALLSAFLEEYRRQGAALHSPGQMEISGRPTSGAPARSAPSPDYRVPLDRNGVTVLVSASGSASASVYRTYEILLPVDGVEDAEVLVVDGEQRPVFGATLRDLLPAISSLLQIRLNVFARTVLGELLTDLRTELARRAKDASR